jgi:hypothetical protein
MMILYYTALYGSAVGVPSRSPRSDREGGRGSGRPSSEASHPLLLYCTVLNPITTSPPAYINNSRTPPPGRLASRIPPARASRYEFVRVAEPLSQPNTVPCTCTITVLHAKKKKKKNGALARPETCSCPAWLGWLFCDVAVATAPPLSAALTHAVQHFTIPYHFNTVVVTSPPLRLH